MAIMSKRSVDKGDSGKKTTVKPNEAKPREASSVPLEKKANAACARPAFGRIAIYIYTQD